MLSQRHIHRSTNNGPRVTNDGNNGRVFDLSLILKAPAMDPPEENPSEYTLLLCKASHHRLCFRLVDVQDRSTLEDRKFWADKPQAIGVYPE